MYSSPRKKFDDLEEKIGKLAVDEYKDAAAGIIEGHVDYYPGAKCLTCDAIDLYHADEKYNCLVNFERVADNLPFSNDELSNMRKFVAAQKKLLFELGWNRLSQENYSEALSFYKTAVVDELACGYQMDLPDVSQDCSANDMQEVFGTIELCQRLRDNYVSPELVKRIIPHCFNLLTDLSDSNQPKSSSSCNGGLHREQLKNVNTELLFRQLETINNDTKPQMDEIRTALSNINRWYRSSKTSINFDKIASVDSDELLLELDGVLNKFWRVMYRSYQVRSPADDLLDLVPKDCAPPENCNEDLQRQIEAKLLDLSSTGELVDIVVLSELFSLVDAENVPTPVLVILTGDALESLYQRIEDLTVFHDFACHFDVNGCRPAISDTPLSVYFKILSSLYNKDELNRALSTNTDLRGWKSIFDKIWSTHDRAIGEATKDLRGVKTGELKLIPDYGRPLTKIIWQAKERYRNFFENGLFDARERNVLYTGVSQENRENIIKFIRHNKSALCDSSGGYQYYGSDNLSSFRTMINDLINQLGREANLEMLKGEREMLLYDIEKQEEDMVSINNIASLDNDLSILSSDVDSHEKAFSEMFEAIAKLKTTAVGESYLITVRDSEKKTISANDAKYDFSSKRPSDLAVYSLKNIANGNIIQITTTGEYAPNCALRNMDVMSPEQGGAVGKIDVAGALTGPEGYMVHWSGESYRASGIQDSTSESHKETAGVRGEVCVTTGPATPAGGVEARACAFAEKSSTYSDDHTTTESSGKQVRATASFTAGMRSRNTPFPDMTVGSLLAVFTAKDDQSRILDILPIRRPSTFIPVPADVESCDMYLVVNDSNICNQDENSNSPITMTAFELKGAGDATPILFKHMASVLAKVRQKRADLKNLGRLSVTALNSFRSEAITEIDTAMGLVGGWSTLPQPFIDLWNAFLDKEILVLESTVQINAIEREIEMKKIRLQALEKQIARGEVASRLSTLLTRWTIRNIDGAQLRNRAAEVLEVTRHYLYPILSLWYPRAFDGFIASQDLDRLKNINLDSNLVELATDTCAVIEEVLLKWEEENWHPGRRLPSKEPKIVVVSYPKPGTNGASFFHPEADYTHRTASATEAAMLWTELLQEDKFGVEEFDEDDLTGWARISITPELIYSGNNTPSNTLSCKESLPTIEYMAVYIAGNSLDPTNIPWIEMQLEIVADGIQTFSTATGLQSYQLINKEYSTSEIDIIGGGVAIKAAETMRNWTPKADQRPICLSPFGTFHIELAPFHSHQGGKWLLNRLAEEFLIVMALDSSREAEDLCWIDACMCPDSY